MHNIEYYTYDEGVDRKMVQAELDDFVRRETWAEGGHGISPIRWMDKVAPLENYEAAEKAIEANDRKWYDQLAVRYYEPDARFSDKKVEELQAKVEKTYKTFRDLNGDVWAKGLASEYVGCRNCGSRLKRSLIRANSCPVCGGDLRPDSTLKAVESAKKRWNDAQGQLISYKDKHAKKTVKWLVKIEYHT